MASLTFISGPLQGRTIQLPAGTVHFGRDPAATVSLDDPSVSGHHAKLEVADVRPREGGCRFTGRRRTLGMLQSDDIEVTQRADGSSTLRSVAGSNKGLLITQTFEAVAADRTRVRTTVELPFPGILFFLVPLVRMGLQRDVEAALEEDRIDLEQRGYPRR